MKTFYKVLACTTDVQRIRVTAVCFPVLLHNYYVCLIKMQVMCAKPCSNDYNKCIYILPTPIDDDYCLYSGLGYKYFKI